VSHTIKLAALGTLLMPVLPACNNKKESSPPTTTLPGKDKNSSTRKPKKTRNKWSHEGLVLNTKTGNLHLPSSRVYRYYDPIKPIHLKEISIASWAAQAGEPVKLHKQQSGNILEILAMQGLQSGVNDQTLETAIATLSRSFTASCDNAAGTNLNSTNFRLHELLLQLVSLNNIIPLAEKWNYFNSRIKRPATLRKRQQWMETETAFNERVNYILNHKNEYITRLNQRASKYTFT